jgi:hypothetical protein
MGFANFLAVARTAMRATVVARAAFITAMLSAVMALIDVAKCDDGRFSAAVRASTERLIVSHGSESP